MTAPPRLAFTLASPDATASFAARLAPVLTPGDVLLLEGEIGSGKTHFARALIQARLTADGAAAEDVPSPTFTLVQSYHTGQVEIWHADLYRLSDLGEIEELGLADAFDTAICLVEWPDRLGDLAPDSALVLSFTPGDGPAARVVTAWSHDPGWAARLAEIQRGG